MVKKLDAIRLGTITSQDDAIDTQKKQGNKVDWHGFNKGQINIRMDRVKWVKDFLEPHHRLLDIGCSVGFITSQLSKFCKHVDAIDIAEERIKIARRIHNRENIDYVVSSFEEYCPEPSHLPYDVITCYETIEHVYSGDFLLKKANSLLRGGE